jgi:hypothetical protein
MQEDTFIFLERYLRNNLPEELLFSTSPSFDLNLPRLPGNQDVRGIPNATPEMLRRYLERKIKNPGGQTLPGFLKQV